MLRTLILCAALTAFPLYAQAEKTVTPSETLIQLKVQPMPEPKPALRYLLLPELKEMQPGNPIPNYLRCLLDQDFSSPVEALRASALRQADRAARLDKPDWQILLKAKSEGISLLLPDIQKMRMLATALQERFRTEVAHGHFDDALRSAKTMFALARHMGENPTLIADLVGIAIAAITIEPLEQMLAQPGCPNLYWALTNLPSPLVPMEKGWEGERLMISGELKLLDEKAPMSAEQLQKVIAHIDFLRQFDDTKGKRKSTRAWLNERNKDDKVLQAARRRLVEVGFSEERLARFPADQVLLLDEMRAFEVMRDESLKLMKLPTWQMETLHREIKPPKDRLFGFLAPAFHKVRRAQGRLEQRIAMLRHVEALRMYAADHDGKFPDKLSDCPVPLPEDPFTGKPFRYRKEGETVHLLGTPPKGVENNAGFNIHYELTIQKVAK